MADRAFRLFPSSVLARSFIHRGVATETAAFTASRKKHSGRTTLLDLAAGFTVTLPAASGTGNRYRFMIKTTLTGDTLIKVANATDVMVGGILINDTGDTTAATVDFYPTAATSDTITFDGAPANGGHVVGDWVELEDFVSGKWAVRGVFQGAVDPATPFSATVS